MDNDNKKKKYKVWKKVKKEIMSNQPIPKYLLVDKIIILLAYIDYNNNLRDLSNFYFDVIDEKIKRKLYES